MNNNVVKVGVFVLLLIVSNLAKGQILISLLFGDALNTPKIEFGLAGGLNRSYFKDVNSSTGLNNFNLGFYFHINMKNQSFLSTGVQVKSTVGASGMPTYLLGDPDFDNLYQNGELITKVNYFYLPIMFHQRFNNRWYIEGGVQVGFRNGVKDVFEVESLGGDLSYTTNTKSDYNLLDVGGVGGLGYKFKKELKSLSAGVSYYYGLVDITKDQSITIKNSSLLFFVRVPIGLDKKGSESKTE